MKKLKTYMLRYAHLYIFGFVCMVAAIILDMLSPQITKAIIDRVIRGGESELLMKLLWGLVGIGLGRAILQYAKEYTYDYIGICVGSDMRKDLFAHIQTLSMDFFDSHNTGELMTRVKEDVDKVWAVLGFVGILAAEALVHTVFVLVCMFQLNPWLTLVPLAVLPVIGFTAVHLEKHLGGVYEEISDETAELNTVAQECIAGVRTVKAFAREDYEIRKFSSHNRRFYDLNMKQARLVADHQPMISFLGKVMLLMVVVVGGIMVIRDSMTLGSLGAFLEYANNVIWPMEILGWLSNDIASAVASWKKIQKVAAEKPVIADKEDVRPLQEVRGEIVFDHVSYARNGQEILRDVSFTISPGHTLGIMGMTGAGKTTVVNLLQRFYDVTSGRILLDGRDIREIPLAQLRSSMAVVMQEVFLFSDTVEENVKTGRREMLDTETVRRAAEAAGADRFIGELGEKYETVIGERGVGLSGGQKQRISIARAIAKDAPVLILDDATSALDMETEKLLQRNLREISGLTKIIIGHRISAVREADEIIILDKNTIAERGTHEELMRLHGHYYQTWMVQYGEQEASDGENQAGQEPAVSEQETVFPDRQDETGGSAHEEGGGQSWQ